jgi:hypothetical protein
MHYLPSAPLIISFPLLRAVFGRANEFFYPDPESVHLFPSTDGLFETSTNQVVWTGPTAQDFHYLSMEDIWKSTGDAPVLFLMTPFELPTDSDLSLPEGSGILTELEVDTAARERLTMARAAIVAVLGRNAAFEELFEILFEFDYQGGSRSTFLTTERTSPTTFDPPKLDGFSAELAKQVVEGIQSQDTDTKNRLLLALRWYLLAQRNPLRKNESYVDLFISYWIALESLAGPNEAVASIRRMLKEMHGLQGRSNQSVEDNLFPIGRIFGLRGRIVHEGHTPEIGYKLLSFMDDLFTDILLHTLGLATAHKTDAYLDGSAIGFLP